MAHRLLEEESSAKSASELYTTVEPSDLSVARELAPAGARSGPSLDVQKRGLLRSPAGASSLATKAVQPIHQRLAGIIHTNPLAFARS
ncbi:hypothetical protein FHG55_04030 [Pseudomonas jessenii]|uniref:Uncharacterized protein n=1 Tax=Pseudomonas jessenii TaxID=77298 RepID=A0A5C4L275_PSEJE|nr:hypothetical protein FHG55_04030 [Pseudomonas jessenii]